MHKTYLVSNDPFLPSLFCHRHTLDLARVHNLTKPTSNLWSSLWRSLSIMTHFLSLSNAMPSLQHLRTYARGPILLASTCSCTGSSSISSSGRVISGTPLTRSECIRRNAPTKYPSAYLFSSLSTCTWACNNIIVYCQW